MPRIPCAQINVIPASRRKSTVRGALANLCKVVAALSFIEALACSPLAAQNADWKTDWDRTVAAAKQEGALIISGPSGSIWREQLLNFQKTYPEIKLSITPFASRDFWPRVFKERDAGQYLWDLRIGGIDTPSYNLKNQGALVAVRPLLVLPEVIDDSKWIGGLDSMYLDHEKTYLPTFVAANTKSEYYNRAKIVDASGLTMKTLIDPKWAGKISMADPRAGSSLNTLTVLDMLYGDDFITKLMVNQKPVITKEPRQQLDWLSSGRYPIAFGLPSAALVEYGQRGGRIEDFVTIPGLDLWSPGVGGIQIPTHTPHPNATKVYVNWLLTRDVQASLMQAVQLNSRRNDVPLGAPDQALDMGHIKDYIGTQIEDLQSYSVKVTDILHKTTP
jgi:ABC-type Fe3+ transport system substrate-binding protein